MDLFNEKYLRGNCFQNLYVNFVLLSSSNHFIVQFITPVEVRNHCDVSAIRGRWFWNPV